MKFEVAKCDLKKFRIPLFQMYFLANLNKKVLMEPIIIHQKIQEIRGLKVILDSDLAALYGIETKYLKRTVKNNIKRFPPDFMFTLTKEEFLRCKNCTSKSGSGGTRYLPYAFTEQGIAMLSGLLNTDIAIEMNISIMRAFVQLRKLSLLNKDLEQRISELEAKYDVQFQDVFEVLNYLVQKEKQVTEQAERPRIGF
jgi:hypothetical protein